MSDTRYRESAGHAGYAFGPFVVDAVKRRLWREGRLVGTVDEIREQAEGWAALGVETLIVGLGAVPFAVTALDDLELVARAVRG